MGEAKHHGTSHGIQGLPVDIAALTPQARKKPPWQAAAKPPAGRSKRKRMDTAMHHETSQGIQNLRGDVAWHKETNL